MTISLRKLEIFVNVATLGSVTGTADKLLLSQSAVSMALADLESRYAGPLFHRRGRKLIVNDRGRLLLPLARESLRQAAEFERLLTLSGNEPAGRLLIGASTTIGNYLLPLLMADFPHRYPQAQVAMQVGNSEIIATALDDGELDLALIEGPCHIGQLERTDWRVDELVVICGKDHSWAAGKPVAKSELLEADWIIRERGSGTREVFEQALELPLSRLASVVELGHTEAIKKAVEAGLGVSCLSRLAVRRELDQGWLVAVNTPLKLFRTLSLLLPGKCEPSPLVQACLDLLSPKSG